METKDRTMISPTRLQQGRIYHIYIRGLNRRNVFFEERTYSHFLRLYDRCIEPMADTYAYCLLPDHLHFLIRIRTQEECPEVPEAWNPGHHFTVLFDSYTKAINKAYGRTGSLFQKPFGQVQVAAEVHLVHLVAYIHQNPTKHGLVEDFRDWSHSSYQALLPGAPTNLRRHEVLTWFDGPTAFRQFHQQPVVEALIAELAPDEFD